MTQERFKSNLEFRYQIIVSSIKFKNGFATFMIRIVLFKKCLSLRSAGTYAQSDQSLCLSVEYFTTVKLLTEQHLKFISLKGGYTGSPDSTFVKMPHCWKSHVVAHIISISLKIDLV